MNTVIIMQARMTSTRLPGKVLLPIRGRPMLAYQLERLRRVRQADRLVIATTTNVEDDPIAAIGATEGVLCARGSERNVLSRFQLAAAQFGADVVVRVTADCPLIDPEIVDAAIDLYSAAPGRYDFVSNMLEPTYPYGMAVEVFSAQALRAANSEAVHEVELEHVTPFIYWRPDRFRLRSLTMHTDLSKHRWTVDTPEDFILVSRILEAIYPRNPTFRMADVLALLAAHPEWEEINRNVVQKLVTQQSAGFHRGA